MKKIKTVFVVDRNNGNLALPIALESSAWVLNGEGVATVKYDGTSCMVDGGVLYKRMDRKLEKRFAKKKGRDGFIMTREMFKEAPEGWVPCEPSPDLRTGHWPGWVPVREDAPEDRWHIEAWSAADGLDDGTYELVGPKVQANRYALEHHELWQHGNDVVEVPRDFEGLRDWIASNHQEGLVFHHADGRMAKLRRKDFGLDW